MTISFKVNGKKESVEADSDLSLIHISEPTRPERIGVGGVGV